MQELRDCKKNGISISHQIRNAPKIKLLIHFILINWLISWSHFLHSHMIFIQLFNKTIIFFRNLMFVSFRRATRIKNNKNSTIRKK